MHMKKLILLTTLFIALPASLFAQDDDMYFVPTKKNIEKVRSSYGMPSDTYYSGSNRNVDEYNRRSPGFSFEVIQSDSVKGDIINFDGEQGVYPDSVSDFSLTRKMTRWDGYTPADAYWQGYDQGRTDEWRNSTWHSPWYYSSSFYPWYDSWYDPWYYDYGWGWRFDPWYYRHHWYGSWGWGAYYGGYYGYYGGYHYAPVYHYGGYYNRGGKTIAGTRNHSIGSRGHSGSTWSGRSSIGSSVGRSTTYGRSSVSSGTSRSSRSYSITPSRGTSRSIGGGSYSGSSRSYSTGSSGYSNSSSVSRSSSGGGSFGGGASRGSSSGRSGGRR